MKPKEYKAMTALELIAAVEKLGFNLKEAVKLYRGWLNYHPTDALAYAIAFNLGTVLKDQGEDVAAEKSYRFAIKLNPNCMEAQFNLGAQLQRLNRHQEAVTHWQSLLSSGRLILPRDQKIHDMIVINLGGNLNHTAPQPLLEQSTDPYHAFYAMPAAELMNVASTLTAAETVNIYRGWLQRHAEDPLAYAITFNLGAQLKTVGEDVAAEEAYRQAVALNPHCIQAQFNLGAQLERLSRPEEALAQWQSLLNSGYLVLPRDQEIYLMTLNNLGRLFEIQRNYSEAEDYLTQSLLAEPNQTDVLHHWYFIRLKQCEWPVCKDIPGVSPEKMLESASALAVIASTDDTALQLRCMQRYVKEKVPDAPFKLSNGQRYEHQKIRVGYLSSDFCMHAVSLLTVELFELHNRDEFEVYGFCWSKNDGTAFHQRVIGAFDHYIQIGGMTDEDAAKLIHSKEIDILVDLHGLTNGARPKILSYRPAPIQVTYLGLPATTGLPSLDYVIADRFLIPEEEAVHYSEKPLYMPDVYQISDRKRVANAKPSRESCGLPNDAFVFCSLNNNYKYTPEMFEVWMNILHRTSNTVLWLLSDNPGSEANLRIEAESRGIASERIIFTQRMLPEDYLARYQVADLFLDTFPFNAGTTANDALWMGLPILTYSGRSFASRMAGALLTAARLPELITFNLKDYEEKAVFLANNPHECERMRIHLQNERKNGVLFDAPRFVRNLERGFKHLVEHLKGRNVLTQIVENYQLVADIPAGYSQFSGHSAAFKEIVRYVYPDKQSSKTLLDIGFGIGDLGRIVKVSPETQNWHVDGIDGFYKTCCNVELFNKKYYRNIWHGLAQNIPIQQLKSYDMLCLFDVIEHLDAVSAKALLRSLLESLGDHSCLILSTPLWFYPQDHNLDGDLEEHLIGIPALSLLALKPTMYYIESNFLIGNFVFTKKSLDFIDKFEPTTNRAFDLQAGRRHLSDLGLKADNVLYFVRD